MRKYFSKRFLKFLSIEILIGIIIGVLFLLYSANYTLIGFIDAITVSTVILFALGWFMFISNEHLLDILFYGVAAFGKALFGRRMKESYHDHIQNKKRVEGIIYWSFWLTSLIYGFVLLILFIIYK